TIAKQAEKEGVTVSLISGDRDLLQLSSENIKICIPKTKKTGTEIEDYYPKDVYEKYQVSPMQIIDLKGLMGDASDNIPGVPGIGEKTSIKIIKEFGSVEEAILHVNDVNPKKARENLAQFADQARLSKLLATIKTDCPIEYCLEDAKIKNMFTDEAYEWMKRFEFKTILKKFNVGKKELDLCGQFATIQGKEKMVATFEKINTHVVKGNAIGIYICTDEEVFIPWNNSKKMCNFAKQDGQLSLFEIDEFESKTCIVGISISLENAVYYFEVCDTQEEEELVKQLCVWLKQSNCVSVIDLKRNLYILSWLFHKYEVKNCDLNELLEQKIFDCAIAGYLLNPLLASYDYEQLASDYLGISLVSKKDYLGKEFFRQKKEKNYEDFVNFCCYQAYVAEKLKAILSEKIEKSNMVSLFWDVEMPLVYVLYKMEQRGIRVNKEELEKYGKKLAIRIKELELEIYSLAGEDFNINSPKQLGVILFEKLQLPFGKKTKTGYSTSADILEKLKCDYPIVEKILEYRQLTKLKSTYADGLANFICENDGRIHGRLNQTVTATGRLSSTEPNLQNIPIRMDIGREIRKVFIPREGFVFLDADYSQIELRILAHISKDENLIKAYNSGQDIHRITASEVFHIPFEEVTTQQRSNAKAVNFGIIYGISSFGLGQDLNISKKEAEEYIEKYFVTYPGIKKFMDDAIKQGKEKGYVLSLMNRVRPIPELSSSNFMQRSFGERIAMNSPIQGTAADIIKVAMVQVEKRLTEENLKSRLLLQVHDELLIEAHPTEVDRVRKILEEEMSSAMKLDVVLEVEVKEGNNWNEAH
ncbi:MAG: DNA polymerase I, partial [Lachnospiraceae bacterium]|nr:DNA polymerase I [Lachnospiraceae bacterium]